MAVIQMRITILQSVPGAIALGAALSWSAAPSGRATGNSADSIVLRNFTGKIGLKEAVSPKTAVILVDGLQSGTPDMCVKDKAVSVQLPLANAAGVLFGNARIAVGNFTPSATCRPEVAVFSYSRAMRLDLRPSWTASASDVVVEQLSALLHVKLNIWVPDGDVSAAEFAKSEALLASALYLKNRSGLEMRAMINDTTPDLMGKWCADTAAIREAGPPLYKNDQLNVYFVDVVPNPSGVAGVTDFGRNCIPGAPNIMFISISDHIPGTLAHEIGHAFSLLHTNLGSDPSAGFTAANIMHNAADATQALARHHLTLGQAYRINVHKESWLNTPAEGAAPLRVGKTKMCQAMTAIVHEPCPWEALEWP